MELQTHPISLCSMMVLVGALVASCNQTVSRGISRDQIGTKYARLQGYFGAADRKEDVPGDIRHEVVIDEATLSSVSAEETCAQVVIRTARRLDEPLSQLQPRCRVERERVDAIAVDEVVSVYDYSYTGRLETVAADAVVADEYLGLSISEPAERTFRVIERKARVCCPVSGDKVAMIFENDRMDYNNVAMGLEFSWQLR